MVYNLIVYWAIKGSLLIIVCLIIQGSYSLLIRLFDFGLILQLYQNPYPIYLTVSQELSY